MFPKFIEVTRSHNNESWKCAVNVANIVFYEDHTIWATGSEDGGLIWVEETYDEIKQLIEDCGCMINKRDSRLDRAHPLIWSDLCRLDMIGEPVWNSNSQRWMLIIDSANDNTWIELINHAGGHEKWIGHDARKFPLYRMRK